MDDEQCQEGSETSNKNIWTVNGYIFIGNYQGKLPKYEFGREFEY